MPNADTAASADTAPTADTPSSPATDAPRRRLTTTDKLLAGILAAIVLLVAAVGALAGVVWVRTEPAPVPTGPSKPVTVTVKAHSAIGSVALTDASGISTAALDGGSAEDSRTWTRDVAYGASIEAAMTVTTLFQNDDYLNKPSLECAITSGDTTVAQGQVATERGIAVCKWTNTGQ